MLRWAQPGTRPATRRRLSRSVGLAAPRSGVGDRLHDWRTTSIAPQPRRPHRSRRTHWLGGTAPRHRPVQVRDHRAPPGIRPHERRHLAGTGEIEHGRLGNIGPVCDVDERHILPHYCPPHTDPPTDSRIRPTSLPTAPGLPRANPGRGHRPGFCRPAVPGTSTPAHAVASRWQVRWVSIDCHKHATRIWSTSGRTNSTGLGGFSWWKHVM